MGYINNHCLIKCINYIGDTMALPQTHPLLVDELIVLICSVFMESFNPDEQAVIGTFLAALGSMISLNSVYILYSESFIDKQDQNQEDKYELIEKSIDKIKEEISKLKK